MILTQREAFYIYTKNALKNMDWRAVRRILAYLVDKKYLSLERFKDKLNPYSDADEDLRRAVKDLQEHPDRDLFKDDPLIKGERDFIKYIISHPGAYQKDELDAVPSKDVPGGVMDQIGQRFKPRDIDVPGGVMDQVTGGIRQKKFDRSGDTMGDVPAIDLQTGQTGSLKDILDQKNSRKPKRPNNGQKSKDLPMSWPPFNPHSR